MTSVILADQYEILMNSPLPELNTATAKAYQVKDLSQPTLMLYALKTSVFPAPRLKAMEALFGLFKTNNLNALVNLIYVANTTWNQGSLDRSLALIYDRPGAPLMQSLTDVFTPWSEDRLIKKLIAPICDVLNTFRQKQLSHHCLSPTNIFYRNANKDSDLLLGDCLSSPPGYGQHSIFEPIALALADPIGRGESAIAVDLFALGVTLCFLLNGGSPVDLSNEQAIILNRIDMGSFATFLPKKPMSSAMLDLLRGLLVDEENLRWGLKEISTWLSGGRVATPGVPLSRRASRPIHFNGQDDIFTPTILAYEMRRNPIAALEFISKNDLVMWLKNGLNDHARVHLLEDLKAITLNTTSASEKLIGVLQILDKGSALYWQGKSFTGLGLGNSLAQAMIKGDSLEGYIRLISSPILSYYLNDVPIYGAGKEEENLGRKIQMLRNSMEYRGMGGGIESCLYYLTKDVPCLSSSLKNFNVLRVPDIIIGLDLIGKGSNRPDSIIDKHIAAFIAAHEPSVPQRFFHELDTANKLTRHVVVIKLFAELQHRYKLGSLPGLAKWIVDISIPLLLQYKNIPLRHNYEAKLSSLIEEGNLTLIARLLDNKKLLEADHQGFHQAQVEAIFIEKKVKEIMVSLENEKHYSRVIGTNNAMIISAILSLGFTLCYILSKTLIL